MEALYLVRGGHSLLVPDMIQQVEPQPSRDFQRNATDTWNTLLRTVV